jgi:hypothetical protein
VTLLLPPLLVTLRQTPVTPLLLTQQQQRLHQQQRH